MVVSDERGVEQFRLPDIPVHSGAGTIACPEPIT
jgi:hypothetical protein